MNDTTVNQREGKWEWPTMERLWFYMSGISLLISVIQALTNDFTTATYYIGLAIYARICSIYWQNDKKP